MSSSFQKSHRHIREKQQRSIYFKGILSRDSQRKHQREKKQRDKAQIKEVQQFSESGNSILYSQNKEVYFKLIFNLD